MLNYKIQSVSHCNKIYLTVTDERVLDEKDIRLFLQHDKNDTLVPVKVMNPVTNTLNEVLFQFTIKFGTGTQEDDIKKVYLIYSQTTPIQLLNENVIGKITKTLEKWADDEIKFYSDLRPYIDAILGEVLQDYVETGLFSKLDEEIDLLKDQLNELTDRFNYSCIDELDLKKG